MRRRFRAAGFRISAFGSMKLLVQKHTKNILRNLSVILWLNKLWNLGCYKVFFSLFLKYRG